MASLVIEGFPRSGTTFLYQLVKLGFPDHDVFHAEHVASKLSLNNTIVVVRDPYESVFSWQQYFAKLENISDIAKWYTRYHNCILENIDNLIVINFNEMIKDPQTVLKKISDEMSIIYKNVDTSKLNKNENHIDYNSFVIKEMKEAYSVYKEIIKKC